nr:hypothetical protein Iba_chr09cCG6310 [Ipomoea batatas]
MSRALREVVDLTRSYTEVIRLHQWTTIRRPHEELHRGDQITPMDYYSTNDSTRSYTSCLAVPWRDLTRSYTESCRGTMSRARPLLLSRAVGPCLARNLSQAVVPICVPAGAGAHEHLLLSRAVGPCLARNLLQAVVPICVPAGAGAHEHLLLSRAMGPCLARDLSQAVVPICQTPKSPKPSAALCVSASRPSPTQPTTAGNHRRDDDRPTLPSAAPPSTFTHRLPFAVTLLLYFSYATDDRLTLPSAIPPPAFTHRLRPNQHRLPSAFAHRLRTSTATLAACTVMLYCRIFLSPDSVMLLPEWDYSNRIPGSERVVHY